MIYDVDFGIQAKILTRPKYRKPRILAFLKSLVAPLDWLRKYRLQRYKYGSFDSVRYSDAVAYNIYDVVIWEDGNLYMRFTETGEVYPSGTIPSDGYTAGQRPPSKYWIKASPSFIGTDERVSYTSQLVSIEYRLNRWFFVLYPSDFGASQFWPDNYPDKTAFLTNHPQIYIQQATTDSSYFMVGIDEEESSSVGLDNEFFGGIDYVGLDADVTANQFGMVVNFPFDLIGVTAASQSYSDVVAANALLDLSRLYQLEAIVNKSKQYSIQHAYNSY